MLKNAEEIRTPKNSGKPTASFMCSRGILVSIMTRLRTGRLGVPNPAGGRDIISSPKRPDWLWRPISAVYNGNAPGV